HFLIRQRGLRARIPIDHPPTAINQFLLVKIAKNFADSARVASVHRVTLTRPIARATETLELLNDDTAVFVLPLEHALEKSFAAEIVPRNAFVFAKPFLNRGLGADAGMVHSGQPKHFEALHSRAPG